MLLKLHKITTKARRKNAKLRALRAFVVKVSYLLRNFNYNLVLPVGYAMRHMCSGDMLGGRLAMTFLVVKENIRTEGLQKSALGYAAQEQRFIDTDAPSS